MIIKDELLSPYEILCEDDCYTLRRRHLTKKGREATRVIGYFSHLSSAVERIARLKVADSGDSKNLKEYLADLDAFRVDLKRFITS